MKPPAAEATCAACMKRKKCVTTREMESGIKKYENFFYSEQHRGWICKQCHNRIKELGTEGKGWPNKPGRSP